MFKGFRDFILRGNVVDLGVGVIIGASFGAVTTALVKDLLTPLIAAIFKQQDFANMYFTINGSKFLIGDFLNALITFLLAATAVYFAVVLPMNFLMKKFKPAAAEPTPNKKCPECYNDVPAQAKRCGFCTSQLS